MEIKVADYQFIPSMEEVKNVKKLHWLKDSTLKNLEDVRDYNKVVSPQPLRDGISKLRFMAHTIKNNGLLIGICNSKGKEGLSTAAFNDPNLVCINSCGYIINQGAMMFSPLAKIKSGDAVKMIVNKSQGIIRWFCNDIEIATADMGYFRHESIYPIIGLGCFGDEIEVLKCEPPKNIDKVE